MELGKPESEIRESVTSRLYKPAMSTRTSIVIDVVQTLQRAPRMKIEHTDMRSTNGKNSGIQSTDTERRNGMGQKMKENVCFLLQKRRGKPNTSNK